MTIKQKLQYIQQSTGLTQTQLAGRFGVSFAAFNSWWTEKSQPRPQAQAAIEDLFLEVSGRKVITPERLADKKAALRLRQAGHRQVLKEILSAPDIHDEFILKLTYHSGRIEGSTLDEPETAAILFDNVALPDRSLTEQLEAKNHQTAIDYLFSYLSEGKKINESLVLKLHGILMNGVRADAGNYRRHAVRLLGVSLPTANYLKIPELLPALMADFQKASDKQEVISLAAGFHARFEQIHPFSDGNGRIGRLLLTAMLLEKNLTPAIIRQEEKRLYYTYLYKAQAGGDVSQLEDFIIDAVSSGFDILERRFQGTKIIKKKRA